MVLLLSQILLASFAALVVFSNATPSSTISVTINLISTTRRRAHSSNPTATTDPCSILALINPKAVKYNHVVNCYNAIPFDNVRAATTLPTVITIFRDYYVFTDDALSPTATLPFANAPHDILGELEKIGRKKYISDYQFHKDMLVAITSLHDGHAAYQINCYKSYHFAQHIALYASVVDGRQATKRGYEDCTVETINGEDALTYLRTYVRDIQGRSHDPNARLNFVVASQTYNMASRKFTLSPGDFPFRDTIPETPYLDYRLKCGNSTEPILLRDEWRIFPKVVLAFTDAASFFQNVCLVPLETDDDDAPPAVGGIVSLHRRFDPVPQVKMRDEGEPMPGPFILPPLPPTIKEFPGAEALVTGNATVFFHLKDRSDTKILQPLDSAFTSDMRVSKSLQRLAKQSYGTADYGLFNAHDFINFSNGSAHYENNGLFTKPIVSIRNGCRNLWTEKTALVYTPLTAEQQVAIAEFPWTAMAENIRLLTDGRCGSACGMAGYFYTTEHLLVVGVV
ncbi:hypothetical protein EC957_000497 [Mortierella hygrophila]|uniref:Uncharacterized protein n=1 Tax=Mortierella hygrophila TaxID=979708 RepID=A0A9P6K2D7_9FUNG|nr:hypothetical protein EC957_000497 [Mortierella hygrophila]